MNARERMLKVMAGEPVDRVPLVPYISQFACVLLEVKYGRFCREADVLADTLLRCRERFGYDALYLSTDSCMEVEPMGCSVRYFEDDVPTVDGHPWESSAISDCSIKVPDPEREGRMPVYADAIRRMERETAGHYPVIAGSDGPLTIIGHLRGLTRFMMDLLDDPQTCQRLLMEAADASIAFNLANLKAGAAICHFGDPEAALVGPKVYREVVVPAHRKVVAAIQQAGGKVLGHFCGDTSAIIDDLVGLQCDVLNIDNQLGLDAVSKYTGKVCVLGDLDPIGILKNGTRAEMEAAISARMTQMKPSGRFMLGSGCHFPADTPPENVEAFVEFGLKYGAY